MNLELIQGEFSANDAIALITQMVHIKIKYHENKINSQSNEEDIKISESKIKKLQKELFELRKTINLNQGNPKIEAIIKIE